MSRYLEAFVRRLHDKATSSVTHVVVDARQVEVALFDPGMTVPRNRLRRGRYKSMDVVVICFSIDNRNSLTSVSVRLDKTAFLTV